MLDRIDDTIVAISSAPGSGPVGIVRLSGPAAFDIAARVGRSASGGPLAGYPSWTRVDGEVVVGPGAIFPAFFHFFPAPRSYTRQDVVEIYTVGAPPILETVRDACVANGAVPALAGEFTARAFFNGAMDLAQTEAVAGVIRARSDTQLRASRRMLDGAFARRIAELRDRLAALLALVEADIDFAEEPIEFIRPEDLRARVTALGGELDAMRHAAGPVERLTELPTILLLGPPNAGKSTLMNRLSGTSRAICAAVAGTTRDILSAPIRIGRGEAMLLDTAGLDETEDEIIAQARRLTVSTAEHVDLVCIVLDAAAIRTGDSAVARFIERVGRLALPSAVLAVNKCDLLSPDETGDLSARLDLPGWGVPVRVSAATGAGLDELRERLGAALSGIETTTGTEAVWLNDRQRSAIVEADEALRRAAGLAAGAAETIDCADLLAFELREALDALGAVTGSVTTEDLLGTVFANFCIGK